MSVRVLLVDDEPLVIEALRRVLRDEKYEFLTAGSGPEALSLLAEQEAHVILSDYRMPEMNGIEFLAESLRYCPRAVRIVLTAYADFRCAQQAVNLAKVSHFLLKPWDDEHLRFVVGQASQSCIQQHELECLNDLVRRQRDELAAWNHDLEDRVRQQTTALHAAYEETLDALVLAIDAREQATGNHSRRVALYCLYLALAHGLPEERLDALYRGAVLHDIGKIAVPDAVLLKPGPLTSAERAVMEQHVVIGGRLLQRVQHWTPSLPIPLYHHERYDGTGYCAGLTGEEIPIEPRLFAVIDVYDALRSERPYKRPQPHEEAWSTIRAEAGRHFDPAVVQTFLPIPLSVWEHLARAAETTERFTTALATCRHLQEDMGDTASRHGRGPSGRRHV